ncbi:MAG: LPS-assembly protein [Desulforhopalus sp.]|jgi:LPS-assembly protein
MFSHQPFFSLINMSTLPFRRIFRKEFTVPASQRKYARYSVTCCAVASCCTLIAAGTSFADNVSTEEWNISADKVVRYESPNSIVATGNVVLEKKEKVSKNQKEVDSSTTSWAALLGEDSELEEVTADDIEKEAPPQYETTVTINSDWMVYDMDLESIKAKGNVTIITDEDRLTAKEGTLNLVNETGTFTDAIVVRDEDSLHLEGASIEKTGLDTYKIVDGWAITCKIEEGETPPWSFSSANTDIRPGGYAVLKHAMFRIKDVPVLYSPYLIVPIKNTRQTGFLFPEFSYSSNSGFGVNLPFFLNISESADATFFPAYFSNRGFMPGAEFRYVANDNSKGVFTGSFIDDQLSDPSETEYYEDTGYTHDNSDRYWLRGKADYNVGAWQSRLDIDIASDEDYLSEFNSGYTGFDDTESRYIDVFGRGFDDDTETERTNSLKVLKSWSGQSFIGQVIAINEADTDASETDTPLWTLPSADYSGTVATGVSDITLGWDADYVNYWREDGIGGNRFDIHPSLSTPIPLGQYLESRAEISVRNTSYMVETYGTEEWEYDDTQNRFYADFETEVATTLERDFNFSGESGIPLRHQFRPYLKYNYLPDVDQDEIPYFDSVDEVEEENTITYGMDNVFNHVNFGKTGLDTLADYASFTLEQSYDFSGTADDDYDEDEDDDDSEDTPFSDIYAKFKWYPIKLTSFAYKAYYDVYDSEFNAHTVEGSYQNNRGDFITLDYSFKNSSDIDQINGSIGTTVFNSWLLKAEIEHSLADDETNEAKGSVTYQALCWSVKFQTTYTPTDTSFLVVFNLANIGLPLGADF